jgi:LysR family transcriptional regulator, transcriptional activator of the cysJI operon
MFSYSMNSLLVFHEVVKARSFSRAADILFMTQPGVSNHVSQLEAQTGHALLKREKGKFQLTKEGRIVFKYAEKIEALARELEHTIRSMQKDVKPLLRIGSPPVYSRIVMPYILSSFQKAYPDIMLRLDVGGSDEMVSSVLSMQNDIVIVANTRSSKKLFVLPFLKEELVLITAKKHPLERNTPVSLKEVEPYPFILREEGSGTRKAVLSAFQSMNINPSGLIEVKSTEFIKEWVSQGKGVSILVKRAVADDELKSLSIVSLKEALSMEISVCFLKSRKNDRAIQKFSDHAKELSQKPPFKTTE